MIKVGLIGYGKWGEIIKSKLDKFCDVKFVCRSKDNYLQELISDDIDWVVIATPNNTHYQIVKNCLWFGKNVFCEKPLTLTYEESKKLYELADKHKLKLYVDDIQNFNSVNYKMYKNNFIARKKNDIFNNSYCRTRDLLYRLAYHDIYFIYEHIKDKKKKKVNDIDTDNKLNFKI